MLEFFTYKKIKKHREEKAEKQRLEKEEGKDKGKGKEVEDVTKAKAEVSQSESSSSPDIVLERAEGMPILDQEDEKFLERLTSPSDASAHNANGDGDDETPPPLPPRVKTPVIELEDSDASSFASKDEQQDLSPSATSKDEGKGKGKDEKEKEKEKSDGEKTKHKRFSFVTNLSRNISLKRKPGDKQHQDHKHKHADHLTVPDATTSSDPDKEAQKEEKDMARVLSDLNLAASIDNRAFSLSRESAETLRAFTQVLKDLVNGVPTAYADLVHLIEDRDGVLARSYEKMPKALKKLVAQLPDKLTSSLAPELLAVAAEAQGLNEGAGVGVKKLLSAGNLMELVTKPGAVAGLLKGIVNALKTRWPAFVGTNVLWSVAVFLLLSVLWYCYKRGRETRLEKEAVDAAAVVDREVEEVDEEGKKIGEEDMGEGEPRKEIEGTALLVEEVRDGPIQQPAVSLSSPAVVSTPENGKK
ncbi:hypothetical protein GGS26DRAFT_577542 [Hypomontagnella submonticulosa]|nr:hypothetical protein GGS26DRAFT_577542 [Hypomontagnella submonticulosa]